MNSATLTPSNAVIHSVQANPIGVTPEIDAEIFGDVRRQMILDCCKWDPQVGDVSTLAPFALAISAATWHQLAKWSEQLAAEAMAAETELLNRPDLHRELGLPRRIRNALRRFAVDGPTPSAARTIRFDFHWTSEGWRISEANADVPGGFTEASSFASLVAAALPARRYRVTGNPAEDFADAVFATCRQRGGSDTVALLSAAGFMEDHQVISYLASLCLKRGLRACLASPEEIRWIDGRAHLASGAGTHALGAIVRFYQGEWLAHLPRRHGSGWERLFAGGRTPIANPGSSLLIKSKRFPLIWDRISTRLPAWRKLLPETRESHYAAWPDNDRWLLKSAFCNTGDTVSIASRLTAKQRRTVGRAARWHSTSWVAQRVFQTVPLETPLGKMFPCVGVHTVNGRAAGAYARLSPGPVIDYAAVDVALLIDDQRAAGEQEVVRDAP